MFNMGQRNSGNRCHTINNQAGVICQKKIKTGIVNRLISKALLYRLNLLIFAYF